MKKIVLATGGFDPVHSGHIQYLNAARTYGDRLIIGLNSDEWLIRKKGKPFLPWVERFIIMSNLRMVDQVIAFDDDDDSALDAISQIRYLNPDDQIIFVNGGDRTNINIPEMRCGIDNLVFEFGVGGDNKRNSSSWILKEWEDSKLMKTDGWSNK